jgi:hypothetical protein
LDGLREHHTEGTFRIERAVAKLTLKTGARPRCAFQGREVFAVIRQPLNTFSHDFGAAGPFGGRVQLLKTGATFIQTMLE